MKPSFNKTINKNDKYKQNKKNRNDIQNRTSNPISNPIETKDGHGQIISGYFLNEKSYKELVISRVNTFLSILLSTLLVFCFVCYYFVSCKEVQLNKISRATLELNYENDELQNKVDSLQSYYNIDKAVSKSNILERATQVVEVDAVNMPNVNLNKKSKQDKPSMVVEY